MKEVNRKLTKVSRIVMEKKNVFIILFSIVLGIFLIDIRKKHNCEISIWQLLMLYIVIIVTISICCRIIEHIRTWHIINKSDVIIVEDVSVLDLIWAMKDFLKDTVILLPKNGRVVDKNPKDVFSEAGYEPYRGFVKEAVQNINSYQMPILIIMKKREKLKMDWNNLSHVYIRKIDKREWKNVLKKAYYH